jgi:hypothetical protein
MASITFNGTAKTITIGYDAAITSVQTIDIYSRWKDWVLDGNAQYQAAFGDSVGGEDLGGGLFTGSFFFLRNDIGWRIVPANTDHELRVIGGLYPTDASAAIFSPPASANVLAVIQRSAESFAPGEATVDYDRIRDETSERIIPHIWAS